ncbi:MAG: cytochrome c3 family protein [Nitrospirota bacterium]
MLFFPPVPLYAQTGTCSNCHTMHNSQDGSPVATDPDGNPLEAPYTALLISSCVGCHSSDGSAPVVSAPISNTPVVNNLSEPVGMLAGGNFFHLITDDSFGHNIFTSNPDDVLGSDPPGGAFPEGGSYAGQLRCAGTRGCHGLNGGHSDTPMDDQLMSIYGSHHANTSQTDGSTVGSSYRFLYGIQGLEDDDWEQDNVNTSHNEYMGSAGIAETTTINYFCAECHGDYHDPSGVGSSSPWLRHPTDVALPAGPTEYAQYTAYSMLAPVARSDPYNVQNTAEVTPGSDVVMCLSCHRAHASPYYKLMRWDFRSTDLATALSGCGVCHTNKD